MSRLLPFQSDADVPEDRAPRVVDLDGDDAEKVFGALSSETARAIFQALHDEPMTASDIADAVDSSIQNVRYHLEKLADAGLVEVVDTWYSSRGNEMKVYAPKDGPLIVSSDESRASRIRTALSRLVGGVGVLAAASVLIQYSANNLFFGVGSTPETQSPSDGGGAAPSGDADYSFSGSENASGDATTTAADGGAETATATATDGGAATTTDGGGVSIQDAETTTEAATSTSSPTTVADDAGTSTDLAMQATETVRETVTAASDGGASGLDAGLALEPGLMFFLGGLVVLLGLVAYQYRSSAYR